MTTYTRALERLRTLTLATNALDAAVGQAVDDLVEAAESERGSVAPSSAEARGPPGEPANSPSRTVSGMHPKANVDKMMKAVEVERYVRAAWERAQSDEDLERVRELVRKAIASGILGGAAVERLERLIAA